MFSKFLMLCSDFLIMFVLIMLFCIGVVVVSPFMLVHYLQKMYRKSRQ